MIFTQHYLDCLSQGSYLIGDETTGRAVVVDPRRDIDDHLSEAAEHGLRIERVIETHIHADFLSGHLELAAATGALISYGEDAEVEFPIEPLRDGQRISLGQVALEILATPGHTPESICIVVYENADDEVPYGVLTGDTLFVGDVGAPGSAGGQRPVGGDVGPVAARQTSEAARCYAGFSPRTGPDRRAASSCRAKPVQQSVRSAGPTMRYR
jgi:glyoxylase-like metal-dependent hydrolase (beta-lactamase superfamily II)